MVPQRKQVDDAIQAAKQEADDIHQPEDRRMANVIIYCTEALVGQIRDADDTVATVLTPAITEQLTDLTTVIGSKELQVIQNERKGFSL